MSAYDSIARHPASPGWPATPLLISPLAWVPFVGAAVTDGIYAKTSWLMWLHFSQWLIAVGIAFGILAAIALLIGHFVHRRDRWAPGPAHVVLFLLALVIEVVNAFVHTADGWTAIVPAGAWLSIAGAVLAIASIFALWLAPARAEGSWR